MIARILEVLGFRHAMTTATGRWHFGFLWTSITTNSKVRVALAFGDSARN